MSALISAVNAFGADWGAAIWRASWHGAIVVAAVWIACRLWHTMPPHLRVWLWRAAFLKLLFDLVWTRPIDLPVLPPAPAGAPAAPVLLSPGLPSPSVSDVSWAPAQVGHHAVWPSLAAILLSVWLLGALWFLARIALSWRAARRLRIESEPATHPDLLALLADVCAAAGVRRPPTMVAGRAPGPMLIGVRRPVIVLPQALLNQWDPAEARLMLAHELAHVRRRDLLWNCLSVIVQTLFFFHPFVWLARRECIVSQEMASDALALQITRSSHAEYGNMLVRVAARTEGIRDEALAVGITEPFHALRRRLAAIAHLTPHSRRRLLITGAALALIAAAALVPWRATARGAHSTAHHEEGTNMQVGVTESVTLNGNEYEIRWVHAGRLSDAALLATGTAEPRTPDAEYAQHVDPLYNIHCEIGPDLSLPQFEAKLEAEGRSWNEYWQQLAAELSPNVTWFALAAYNDGKLAGQVRFFPETTARLRGVAERPSADRSDDVLLIGAGSVDFPAAEDGLDKELVRRVIDYARQQGYAQIRTLAWSDLRAYALWGESFPLSTYESLGFHTIADFHADDAALDDMLAGHHGPQVQQLVRTALDRGLTKEQAATRYVVQFDLAGAGGRTADYPKSAMLENVPAGGPGINSYARGLEVALNYIGTRVDADTIMGDTGMAFIAMSEEGGPLIDGAVDVGWWPMASWGLEMRLGFLADTVGREIRLIPADAPAYRADPAACYRDHFEQEVKASIARRQPVLAVHDMCFIVYGYDEQEPPLLGNWAAEDQEQTIRLEQYPWALIVLGGATRNRIDRGAADLDALRHALALARDELEIKLPAYWGEWESVKARYTGQKSFALWAEMLRDTDHLGQARWHSNMVFHLELNRGSAVRYLRTMAARHPQGVASHLRAAADRYEEVLGLLDTADTSQNAMMSKDGREKLARLAEKIAGIEARAASEIGNALAAAGSESQ